MASIPGSNADVYFGDPEKPLPDWREVSDEDEEDPSEEDCLAAKAVLGFDPRELDESRLSVDDPPGSASPEVDAVIERGKEAAGMLGEEIRATVRRRLRQGTYETIPDVMTALRDVLAEYEPLLARSLSDAVLAGWLVGARQIARQLPEAAGNPLPENLPNIGQTSSDEPVVVFPQIEATVKDLSERRLLTRDEFDQLSAETKRQAFTVTGAESEKALETIRTALVEDVGRGGTLREFKAKVRAETDVALSDARWQNVYRTGVGQSMKAGQIDMVSRPLVRAEFPYVAYESIHDARRRETHKYMEEHGLNGTNVYRTDDLIVRKFWAPWEWQCRCQMVLLSIEDAAARGVLEARRWLETGEPPAEPEYVPHPPFDLPEGWAPVQLAHSEGE